MRYLYEFQEFTNRKLTYGKEIIYDEPEREFGCVMVDINLPEWGYLMSGIKTSDLHEKGLETEPHATILYGLHTEKIQESDVESMFVAYDSVNMIIPGLGLFSNENFDVLMLTVESNDLQELHQVFKEFPHTLKHKTYSPHITLAYLKPGTGAKYLKVFDKPINLTSSKFSYSTQHGIKYKYDFTKS